MEPQEGDIAADGKGNFLVRRGNDWYPSQQDGRPLQRIPRPDYGANHFQLPNGDIVRQGPRGGQETVENFGGAGGGAGGSGLVSADQRGRYNIGADPLVRAERNLAVEEARGNPLNRDWGAVTLNAIDLDPRGDSSFRPFAPLANLWGGQDYQNAQQALSTYEASLMPIQSGASVTASEAARQIRADFPALGDSAETLRRKAANRRDRINAILAGIGRPPAFTEQDLANPADTSTDREVAALSTIGGGEPFANADPNDVSRPSLRTPENYYPDSAAAIAGPGPTYTGPGSSAANPFVLKNVDLDSEDDYAQRRAVANLSRGMYVQQPDGTVSRLTGDPYTDENAANNQGLGGVMTRGRNLGDQSRAFAMAAAEQVPFLDEAAVAAAGAISGRGYSDVRDSYQALQQIDNQTNRRQRIAGGLVGAAGTTALPVGMLGRGANVAQAARGAGVVNRLASFGARNAPRVAGGAVTGGIYGAGAGEGGLTERGGNALEGAAIGGVLGPVAEPVARLGVNAIRGVGDAARRVVRPNALESATDRFSRRFNPDAGVLAQRADERAAQGLETTFVDLMDAGQQGLTRALATRQTPARQAVRDFAEGRAENLPDRISRQARRNLSADPRSPMEIREQLAATGRREAAPLYEAAYARSMPPSPVIEDLLSRPAGRAALQRAYTIARNEGRNPNELGMFVATRDVGSPAAPSRRPADPELFADLDAMRAGRRTQGPARGDSLLEFISKNGGVRDDGGDLASIGADTWNRQGSWRSRAVRDDGLSLEQMADRARAAGYFDDVADATADSADNYQRISSQDMVRAIEGELRGSHRFARAVGDTDRSANAALRSSRRDALEERLAREGIDISRASNADIARALRDADDAEARAMAFLEGESPGPRVELIPGETPSMQTLDYVKRGLDDVLEDSRNATGQLVLDTNGRAIQQLRRDFRAELDRLNPDYAAARASHASTAALQRATELGEGFLTMEADEFSRLVSRLGPAEREVALAAARRAVERGVGTQGAAPGIAQRLASGREQSMRNAALLENPIPFQEAMRGEREGLMAARRIDPGQGSPTAPALSDQAQAGLDAASAVGSAMVGNMRGAAGSLARLVRLGYSDAEAQALLEAAIDPNRTREVIDMLARRMNRQDARSTLRSIRFAISQQSGQMAGDEE